MKMNTLCFNLIHIKNNVSSNLAEILFILCTISAYIVQSIISRVEATEIYDRKEELWLITALVMLLNVAGLILSLSGRQRRYGLLKPQRSEGGHRLFDEEDIQRIEEIKRWISNGVPVGKVKALLETTSRYAR